MSSQWQRMQAGGPGRQAGGGPILLTPRQQVEPQQEMVDGGGLEGGLTIVLVFAALMALVGDRLMKWGARLGFRLGFDTERSLGFHIRGVQWAGVLVLLALLVRWLLIPLQDWLSPLLLLVALLWIGASTGLLGDLVGGLIAQFRLHLREGDYVTVGERQGEVEEIQLLRIRVCTSDQGRVYVPNRHLLQSSVTVAPLRNAHPLRYTCALSRPLLDEECRALRERLLFVPYRVPGSPLIVRCHGEGRQLEVVCHLWSRRAVEPAEAALRRLCQDTVQLGPGSSGGKGSGTGSGDS